MDPEPVPGDLAEMLKWLGKVGFTLLEDEFSKESFGNRRLLFRRGECCVRAERDRGEWWLEVAGGHDEWADLDIWRSCLEGQEASKVPVPLSEQIRYLRRALTLIDEAILRNASIADCLGKRKLARAKAALGITDLEL